MAKSDRLKSAADAHFFHHAVVMAPMLHEFDSAIMPMIPVMITHHITIAIGSVVVVIVDVSVIAMRVIPAIVVSVVRIIGRADTDTELDAAGAGRCNSERRGDGDH